MSGNDVMPDKWPLIVLAATLVAAAAADLKTRRVPNFITLPAIVLGLVLQSLLRGGDGLLLGLGGLAAGALPLLVCWRLGGIGGGDVKLMAAIGALTNWQFALATLVLSLAAVVVMAVAVMIRRRIVKRTLKRVGWSLAAAVLPGVKKEWPDTADSPKLPFALALCLGAAAALLDAWFCGPLSRGITGH